LQADTEAVAQDIRGFLRIQTVDQKRARRLGANYRLWCSRTEAKDILVFQTANLATKQMLGMELSIIVVNRKLNYNGQVFILAHEFTRLIPGESGICNLSEDHLEPPQAQQTGGFANEVADANLSSKADFLAEPIASTRAEGQHEWSNNELQSLADTYGASEEAVWRRLPTLGLTSPAFYKRKRAEYLARYAMLG
jgi:Zn-dependent peptidase ImmA (M78 family)